MLVVFPRIVSDNGPLTCLLFSIPEYLSLVRADGGKKVPPQWREKEGGGIIQPHRRSGKKGNPNSTKGGGGMRKKGIILYYGPRCVGCKITKFDELDTSGILKSKKKNQSVTKMAEKIKNNYFTVY